MKLNIVIGIVLTLAASAFSLSAIMSCGWQAQAGRAASIESKGFDVLAHRVFGNDSRAQAEQAGILRLEPQK